MSKKKEENGFDRVARLIKEEGEDIRTEFGDRIDSLEKKVEEGFAGVNRRLDTIIQPQLDAHTGRIKKLETAVFK